MNNKFFPLIGIILVAILFVHCSKGVTPDPPPDVTNYTLSVTVSPSASGSVSPSSGSYAEGSSVTLTPTPATGYDFKEWSGSGISSSANPLTLTMNTNMNINAIFEIKSYPFIITIEGQGQVAKVESLQKTTSSHGTVYNLTAIPSNGWEFVEWKGDLISTTNPAQITIVKSTNVTCVFRQL